MYRELIPTHINQLLAFPKFVLKHFEEGCFSVRLRAFEWNGIAIDECHEMKINKEAKMAVVHPSKSKMDFISNYLSFCLEILRNLEVEIFPEHSKWKKVGYSISSEDKKSATNVAQMVKVIDDKFTGMLFEKDMNEELWNVFENIKATPEQAHNIFSVLEK